MTLSDLLGRVEGAGPDDWRLNEEIIAALGGQIRRVSRLGLSGRTRGSERVFWSADDAPGGKRIPNFLADDKSKARAVKRLRALIQLETQGTTP